MMANLDREKKVALVLMSVSLGLQVLCLMFIWNPDKFHENWDKFKNTLAGYKNRIKNKVKGDSAAGQDVADTSDN